MPSSTSLTLLYLPAAIGLGALHALEPGHAKTMIAAYLIGIKGTWRDAVLLGVSAALTHSVVVIALAVAAVALSSRLVADAAGYWLAIGSAVLVTVIGGWLTWRRWRGAAPHRHDQEPAALRGRTLAGDIAVAATAAGERLRLRVQAALPAAVAVTAVIARAAGREERLALRPDAADPLTWWSDRAPDEPHAFSATLVVAQGAEPEPESIPFALAEPEDHHADDEAHARAHAADLPGYATSGDRPGSWQIIAFGAAGGLIPCPASISVMLLALSVGQIATGVVLVFGFSLGLAVTMVGVGLAVVIGWQRFGGSGRWGWVSQHAAVISAAVITCSGLIALLLAIVAGPQPHAHA